MGPVMNVLLAVLLLAGLYYHKHEVPAWITEPVIANGACYAKYHYRASGTVVPAQPLFTAGFPPSTSSLVSGMGTSLRKLARAMRSTSNLQYEVLPASAARGLRKWKYC